MIARRLFYAGLIAAFACAGPVFAQAQKGTATKPANATAECNDGTFSTAKTQTGACSKHGGVKTWFGAETGKAGAAKAPSAGADTVRADAAKADAKKDTGKTAAATTSAAATKNDATANNAGAPPAGATGQCTDGSFTRAKTQQGACSTHGGVKTWFAAAAAGGAASSQPPAAPKSAAPAQQLPPPQPPSSAPLQPAAGAPATAGKNPPAGAAKTAPAASGKAQIVAPPPGTPDNATAKCKDNTYSFAKQHSGACSKHGGVAEWYK